MRRALFALLLISCGPGRDPAFHRLIQFSAVDKLQVANGYVVYSEGGALKRVSIDGGTAEVLQGNGVVDFAATAGHVYAATGTGVLHISVFPTGTFAASELISQQPALRIAADPNGVSWLSCTGLTHAELSGGSPVTVALSASACAQAQTRLTLDSSTAYGVDGNGLWYAPRSGGQPRTFGSSSCRQITAAGGWLYCSNQEALWRIEPLRSAVPEVVLEGEVRTFAISEARIYAALGQDLVSSPRNTQSYEVLGTYSDISAIAVDSSALYFVNTQADLGLLLRTSL